MREYRFNVIVEQRIQEIKKTLLKKAKEYATDYDRLHNFKIAAQRRNMTPESALMGMKEKHSLCIEDIVNNLDKGILPSQEYINEKIGDEINYLILLEALLIERIQNGNKKESKQVSPGEIASLIGSIVTLDESTKNRIAQSIVNYIQLEGDKE